MSVTRLDVAGMMAVTTLLIICAIFAFPEKQSVEACFRESKTVIAIGGCDRGALCAVAFSDGSRGKTIYPLVGDVVYPVYKHSDRYFKNCN